MNDDLQELSSDARSLFDAGRVAERAPAEVRARLWGRLATALPPAAPPVTGPATPTPHTAAAQVAKVFTLKQVALIGAGLLGVGAGIGATAATQLLRKPVPVIAPAQVAPLPPVQVAAPAPVAPILAPQPPPAAPKPKAVRAAPAVVPPAIERSPDDALAAERALIAQARSALQRGAASDALRALANHAAQFPTGRLAEQRDALHVQALLSSGDRPAAERAAAEFQRKYPQSLMGPVVRAALNAKP